MEKVIFMPIEYCFPPKFANPGTLVSKRPRLTNEGTQSGSGQTRAGGGGERGGAGVAKQGRDGEMLAGQGQCDQIRFQLGGKMYKKMMDFP